MNKDNYQAIARKIRKILPFKGNSSRGVIAAGYYTVYSYNTPILRYTLYTGIIENFDAKFYSSTTSKLQSIISDTFYNQSIGKYRKNFNTIIH